MPSGQRSELLAEAVDRLDLLTDLAGELTDTVVVFDRIRENLRMRRREHEETLINTAINQVLSRTIVTSLTVVIVLIPLTLAGGEVLHDPALDTAANELDLEIVD